MNKRKLDKNIKFYEQVIKDYDKCRTLDEKIEFMKKILGGNNGYIYG